MADLIVPAGAVQIDGSYTVAAHYDQFKMGANSVIRTSVDLKVEADRAEFDANCRSRRGALQERPAPMSL